MMFLASTFSETADLFENRIRRGVVALVRNAADPYKELPEWADDDAAAYRSRGFDVQYCDLRDQNPFTFRKMLNESDILHVGGGSAIYLLRLLREKTLFSIVKQQIEAGLIYTGTSAGSMIMAPSIKFCCDDADEQELGITPKSDDELIGFGLVPFYMICHNQDSHYIESTCAAFARSSANKLPILCLNDNQAVWCDNGKFEIVEI